MLRSIRVFLQKQNIPYPPSTNISNHAQTLLTVVVPMIRHQTYLFLNISLGSMQSTPRYHVTPCDDDTNLVTKGYDMMNYNIHKKRIGKMGYYVPNLGTIFISTK